MDELIGKQKSHLRGLGQALQPLLTVGKSGLTPAVAATVGELLSRRELVKVRLPAGPPAERAVLARQLAEAVGAAVAGAVGRTVLLYRPGTGVPPAARVELPPD